MKNKVIAGALYVFSAQGVGLVLSVILTLIIPKIIGVEEFGYWQLFLLYTSYIGFFTLGFNDGFYLKFGGSKLDEINFRRFNPQLYLFIVLQFLFFLIVLGYALSFTYDSKRFIIIILSINIILQNISNFFGMVFQATGNFKKLSFGILIDKLFFLVSITALIFVKAETHYPFLILFTISKLLSLVYNMINAKKFFIWSGKALQKGAGSIFKRFRNLCLIGLSLMISNIIGSLIIGINRFMIEYRWGIETFSKISLALSLTAFFLLFISQIGIVLFPLLRNNDQKSNSLIFFKIKVILAITLPLMFILYYPISTGLMLWLPKYKESIIYLGVLLPICMFEGKFHLLYSTFFKVYRLERTLLKLNIITLGVSLILCALGVYFFNSLEFILYSIVLSLLLRCIMAELLLKKVINSIKLLDLLPEICLAGFFIIFNQGLIGFHSSFWFFITLIIYYVYNLIIHKSDIVPIFLKQSK